MEKFIGFKFGNDFEVGLDKTYDGFIINEDGFAYSLGPEFDDEFASTNYGDRNFYMGTTVGNRTFSFEVQFRELTKAKFREVMYKLRAKKVDILVFDQWEDFGFNVKLASVGEAVYDPIGDCDGEYKYNVRIPLEFVTVNRWWAEKVIEPTALTDKNIGQGGFGYVTPGTNSGYKFTNNNNMVNYLEIEFKGKLVFNGIEISELADEGTFFSEFGIAVAKNGSFICSKPEAMLKLVPGETKDNIGVVVTGDDSKHFRLKMTTRNYI